MHSKKVNIKGNWGGGITLLFVFMYFFFFRIKVNIYIGFGVVHRLFTETKNINTTINFK